jgi:hypothetical protein
MNEDICGCCGADITYLRQRGRLFGHHLYTYVCLEDIRKPIECMYDWGTTFVTAEELNLSVSMD